MTDASAKDKRCTHGAPNSFQGFTTVQLRLIWTATDGHVNEPQTRATLLLKIRDRDNQTAWREFVDIYSQVLHGDAIR